MKSVRKYDVWFADLNEINLEDHYVLIISNWKNNTKSSTVNVCTITTRDKPHPAHVKIMNLDKEVTVCCENIYTIKKDCLIYHSGAVEDVEKQVEIDKALSMQLQVDNKYNNTTPDDMENFFIGGDISNISLIVDLSHKIYESNSKHNYKESLSIIDELLGVLSKSCIEEKNKYMWFSYYHKAIIFQKLGDYDEGIRMGRESFKYLSKSLDEKYSYTMFVLAKCYEKKDKEKAIKIYMKLADYYKKVNNFNLRVASIYNIAVLRRNRKAKLKLIEYTKVSCYATDRVNVLLKKDLLKEMYSEL